MTRIYLGVVLAGALSAIACSRGRATDDPAPAKAIRAGTVSLVRDTEAVKYSAILTPNAQVDLAFRVSGYVVELHQTRGADGRRRPLEPGAHVVAGTVLARIRPADYQAVVDKALGAKGEAQAGVAAAEAQLVQTQASLAQAQLDFSRVSALWEQESITKPVYDASKAKLDVAKAAVDAARAGIVAANKRRETAEAQMREAQIPLADTELRAPFNAVVLERRAELGTLAAAGTPAFTLADLATLKARFNVPDFALAGFREGQSLHLSLDSSNAALAGASVQGRVLSLAAAADPKARSFEIVVAVPNSGLKLRSGMITTVHAPGGGSAPAPGRLQVPASALVHDPGGQRYLVYTIEQNGSRSVAKAIQVEPGPLAGNEVVVLSGLKAGQRIVVMGANLLQPGDPIKEVE
ncbi:MAG: efflux RND transporter periplasmic adaptor subunit [Acidobacteria bacterium]|nr:efflux RND transporter periplasmic adaptor subunit [Acidobacteriota bacterium]